MYTKFEILIIFKSAKDKADYNKICDAFHWMIDNKIIERSNYLYKVSMYYFNQFYNC